MRQPDKDKLIRYFLIAITALAGLVCFWFFFDRVLEQIIQIVRYIGSLVSPFIIAWLVAVISRPLNSWMIQRLHFRPSAAVLVTILLLLCIILGMVLLVAVVTAGALSSLISSMPNLNASLQELNQFVNQVFVNIDLGVLGVDQYVAQLQSKLMQWATQGVGTVFNIAKGTPAAVIWVLVTLVAIFYWCRDEERIVYQLSRLFPKRHRQRVRRTYDNTSHILGGYIRAQALLVFIAAVICTVGMALCGVKNPLVMGIFAGILDIIPVVGPGVVLIAWLIWALFMEKYTMAIGLGVVYVVVIVSRQILNPKLVGDRVGLHPLLALASIFMGMQMFGVIGLILGPILAAIVMMVVRGRQAAMEKEEQQQEPVPAESE